MFECVYEKGRQTRKRERDVFSLVFESLTGHFEHDFPYFFPIG